MSAEAPTQTRRQLIFDTVDDLVSQFLYYDRKEDEELPRDAIQEAIAAGEITAHEIAEQFRTTLQESL